MRKPLEMFAASRMQSMVQAREKTYFVTNLPFYLFFEKSFGGALGVDIPHGGAI